MRILESRNGLRFVHLIDDNEEEILIQVHPRYCTKCQKSYCDHIFYFMNYDRNLKN